MADTLSKLPCACAHGYSLGALVETQVMLRAFKTEAEFKANKNAKSAATWREQARCELLVQANELLQRLASTARQERYTGRIWAPSQVVFEELLALFTSAGYNVSTSYVIYGFGFAKDP